MRRWIWSVVLASLLVLGAGRTLTAQQPGPYAALIQQALRTFLTQAHTWTGVQTFSGGVVTPSSIVNTLTFDVANQDIVLSRGAANRLDLATGDSLQFAGTGRPLLADGTAVAPSLAFASEPTLGFYRIGAASVGLTGPLTIASGTVTASTPPLSITQTWNNAAVTFEGIKFVITDTASATYSKPLAILGGAAGATDLFSVDKSGNVVVSGSISIANAGYFRDFSTGTKIGFSTDGVIRLLDNAGTSFNRLQFGGTTGAFPSLKRNTTYLSVRLADDSADGDFTARVISASSKLSSDTATIIQGSGTGVSVNAGGQVQRQFYKVTIAKEQFVTAGTTHDVTIATLPAKTVLLGVYANITQTFACTATCTSATLSMTLGKAAAGVEYLASLDADLAVGWFGDADAELGTELVRAAAVQGGTFSIAGNIVSLRLTSGTGNIGDGDATNLSQGSITIYLVTERLP